MTVPLQELGAHLAREVFGPAQDPRSTLVLTEPQLAVLLTNAVSAGAKHQMALALKPENRRN